MAELGYIPVPELESEPEEIEPELSPVEALLEWVDENGRLVFGGVVLVLMTCFVLPIFMLAFSRPPPSPPQKSTKKASDKGKGGSASGSPKSKAGAETKRRGGGKDD